MVETWLYGFWASSVIAVAFLAIAALLAVNLSRGHQWGRNPLGAATCMIYLTCGGGHAVHALQLAGPWLGFHAAIGEAARMEYMDWGMIVIDVITAATGVWYWTMRRKFPGLVTGAAVYEDLRVRQQRALDIHDSVVQGLARAKLALALQSHEEGGKAVQDTLAASRQIITELLGKEHIKPGDLRRGGAAPSPAGAGPGSVAPAVKPSEASHGH